MDMATQVREKIAALTAALNQNNPRFPILLKEIHDVLKADPEVVTLLNEEDICIIVTGLKKQTATELASSALKSKVKPAKSLGLMDL